MPLLASGTVRCQFLGRSWAVVDEREALQGTREVPLVQVVEVLLKVLLMFEVS